MEAQLFTEIIGAEKAIEELWKHRTKIAEMMSDVYQLVKNGQLSVFAFGLGGTGKTTLGRVLSGKLNLGEIPSSYNVSLSTEIYNLGGRAFAAVYVPPGQTREELGKRARWDELQQKMISSKRYIVINVVCYGYHSLAQIGGYKEHSLYTRDLTKQNFMKLYLAKRREQEIEILREELLPQLKIAKGDLRLITLVTKQDLWWDDRRLVREHYQEGEYSDLIAELSGHRGVHFNHAYVSCALNVLNFATSDGEILRKTVAGYDSTHWIANYNLVIESLRAIIMEKNA
jgi:hypothetical protein